MKLFRASCHHIMTGAAKGGLFRNTRTVTSRSTPFDENGLHEVMLRQKVDASLVTVRKVLDTARNPQLAEDVPHKYADKYLLAEYMTNGHCASLLTTLRLLGMTDEHMKTMKQWSSDRTVTLRFSSRHKCTFLEKKTREVDSDKKDVVTGAAFSMSKKTVTTVTEYFWKFECGYELSAYKGNEPQEKIVIKQRDGASTKVKTTTDKSPQVEAKEYPSIDVELTWLLQHVNAENGQVSFSIDRSHKHCLTPLRNEDAEKAVTFSLSVDKWSRRVAAQLQKFFGVVQDNTLDMSSLQSSGDGFLPFAPLLEEGRKGDAQLPQLKQRRVEATQTDTVVEYKKQHEGDVPAVLEGTDLEALLQEEERQIVERLETVAKAFPASGGEGLITQDEARLMILLSDALSKLNGYSECMDYLEVMLRKQLVAAIGKEITASDFAAYMQFHNRKMFKEEYAPKPLCLAVRRPNHYPEGTVSFVAKADDVTGENPTLMLTRKLEAGTVPQMKFALSAAAEVTLCGETQVHAYIGHRFSFEQPPPMTLAARSRQFSGYVLLLGRIGGADLFLPSHAMIVQNKDEFDIPLMLDEIPSAQEFRDAIESLSPEQQRFAKAYRSMQLESTLFAVCIVQIKPQLEKVLDLPYDSLTKEIQLTQRLLELFIEYHIPPDLVSFQCDSMEDPDEIPAAKKVEAVKAHVDAMFAMIKDSKQKELDEQKMQHEMKHGKIETVSASKASVPQRSSAYCYGEGMGPIPMESSLLPDVLPQSPVDPTQAALRESTPTDASLPDGMVDVSEFPNALEKQFDFFSDAACIRPTIIKPADSWTKRYQPKLLSDVKTSNVGSDQQTKEKNRAFDLLDALTRSGVLTIEESSMHIVLGATHCFDETLVDTLVKKNVNPIEHVERSMLIVAATLFGQQPQDLVKDAVIDRVEKYSPMLFLL
ncbi:hypothetical protein DIPPA_28425 [Diplonema papillatum]|nr:hypothetical protein DIPPA_28425 [Diplonema papillatum]